MRLRPIAAAAAIAFVAGALTACSPQNPLTDGCEPSHLPTAGTDQIEVTGDFGAPTSVDFQAPLATDEQGIKFLESGEGERASRGDLVFSHFTVFDGQSGEPIFSSFDSGQPLRVSARDDEGTLLESAVQCAAEGSRILAVSTLEDALGEGQALRGSEAGPNDPVVLVYDVTEVVPGRASGVPQPGNPELPAVTVGEDGQPGLSFTGAAAPESLVVSTSIQGNGEEILPGDNVVLQYTGVVWESGEVFDSTWNSASPNSAPDATGSTPAVFELTPGALIDGFYNGLMGQNVGSQVIISVPQEQGYADPNSRPPSIGEGDTLVFVVDILGTL
ncbi:FKBP-type peptidyl-prolyl cis-trans isomerase [uncultured Agrococcus sp.]|uniref:FKBP-type peptidyl-prolyl cis-trans isomerase n=1 Tax=uncultured Agrococcus sp. TaxID=382258 RepID=UPI0025F297B4|nr:FKBP-type peptidyl-prolyl cis-trans isomerase [uncultured Agrococcus sp.]